MTRARGLSSRSRPVSVSTASSSAISVLEMTMRSASMICRRASANFAAQAAVAEQYGLLGRIAQQRVVDAGLTELVDQHRGPAALGRLEEMPHECRLAGAQKAGDDGHGNPRAALAFLPAPEAAGGR